MLYKLVIIGEFEYMEILNNRINKVIDDFTSEYNTTLVMYYSEPTKEDIDLYLFDDYIGLEETG